MNDYPYSAVAGNVADAAGVRAFMQQLVDHYPRLAVFSFTLGFRTARAWPIIGH